MARGLRFHPSLQSHLVTFSCYHRSPSSTAPKSEKYSYAVWSRCRIPRLAKARDPSTALRAGMGHPADWEWSSFRHYALRQSEWSKSSPSGRRGIAKRKLRPDLNGFFLSQVSAQRTGANLGHRAAANTCRPTNPSIHRVIDFIYAEEIIGVPEKVNNGCAFTMQLQNEWRVLLLTLREHIRRRLKRAACDLAVEPNRNCHCE